jgi:D-glycero-D-manno-heptose 1,7-bisphosphate phosphatase
MPDLKPCVFFDRDGIVNVAPVTRYVEKLEDFYLQDAFFASLKMALDYGYVAAIITNQKGVATGATPLAELQAMHDLIQREAERRGLALLDIFYCDAPDDHHPRRKPNPGMLYEAAEKHHLDLAGSWMIGDNESDVLTGQRAGCRTIFVGTQPITLIPDARVDDMEALPALLNKLLKP